MSRHVKYVVVVVVANANVPVLTSLKMSYPVTATLSVDAFQIRVRTALQFIDARRPVGVVGGVVSASACAPGMTTKAKPMAAARSVTRADRLIIDTPRIGNGERPAHPEDSIVLKQVEAAISTVRSELEPLGILNWNSSNRTPPRPLRR
jgi:hypothetical protein